LHLSKSTVFVFCVEHAASSIAATNSARTTLTE